MKADIEKKIGTRVAAAFDDIVTQTTDRARSEILRLAEELVKAVWHGKIYAALPPDKTKASEYFLDEELEQFLNEAIEESYRKVESIAGAVKAAFS
ncbi:MAG TPA: hypothetical protein VNL14_22445 [Candidatus Acidoferrales bacterium]|nr:hypothetical protein [Candidatus Acidoferrales bacterium]